MALNLLDPKSLVETFGLLGVLAIIFAETGLLIGFFMPGDSLLFVAGVAASPAAAKVVHVQLSLPALLVGAPLLAIAGAQLGHYLGAKAGPKLFNRPDSRFFKREYVQRAEHYFTRFGPARAIVLARFIPIVRTFLNPVAGVLEVPAGKFLLWNVVGGVIWTDGVILAGYFLGTRLAGSIDRYLLPAVALVIVVSFIPIAVEILRARRDARAGRGPAGRPVTPRVDEPVE